MKKNSVTSTHKQTNFLRDNVSVDTIFVSNIPNDALTKDIWSFFKKFESIKDIILPRKRDKYGKYSFLKIRTSEKAGKLLNLINGKQLMGHTLKVDMARPKNKPRSNSGSASVKGLKTTNVELKS